MHEVFMDKFGEYLEQSRVNKDFSSTCAIQLPWKIILANYPNGKWAAKCCIWI